MAKRIERNGQLFIELIDEDGEEKEVLIPAKNEVCDECEGHGTHLHPDIGGHAYSPEEFNESFDDEEREHYFRRGGMYDVRCTVCHGRSVILVPLDDEHLTQEQKDAWSAYLDAKAEDAHERRMRSLGLEY